MEWYGREGGLNIERERERGRRERGTQEAGEREETGPVSVRSKGREGSAGALPVAYEGVGTKYRRYVQEAHSAKRPHLEALGGRSPFGCMNQLWIQTDGCRGGMSDDESGDESVFGARTLGGAPS